MSNPSAPRSTLQSVVLVPNTPPPLIEPGRKAPAFALCDADGAVQHLKDFIGRPVVLYFYPKDDTPSCTTEACDFRDRVAALESLTAVVLGISADSSASHRAFAERHALTFPLLVDTPGRDGVPKVCQKYGVWRDKILYGRTSRGIVRTTYLIDEAGKVAQRWDNVRVPGHADAVLESVRALRRGIPTALGSHGSA